MEKKSDRRIRRTKALLRHGLAQLMSEKSVNEVTVKELVDLVDINRSTFYLHYTDIYNMLEKVEDISSSVWCRIGLSRSAAFIMSRSSTFICTSPMLPPRRPEFKKIYTLLIRFYSSCRNITIRANNFLAAYPQKVCGSVFMI